MKTFYAFLFLLMGATSCRIRISGTETRLANKIMGPAREVFIEVMQAGVILKEEEYENYRFLLVRNVGDQKAYFFVEEMLPRRLGNSGDYQRKLNVYLFSDAGSQTFKIDADKVKTQPGFPLLKMYAFINTSSIAKDFTLKEIFFKAGTGALQRGLLIDKGDCEHSSTITAIDSNVSATEGYENTYIRCVPTTYPDYSILTGIKNGKFIYWKAPAPVTATPAVAKKTAVEDAVNLGGFMHACDKNFNFTVNLGKTAKGGFVELHNNISSSREIKRDTIDTVIAKPDTTIVKDTRTTAEAKSDTVKIKIDTAYVVRQFVAPKDTSYPYSNRFDPINFVAWVKNLYPTVDVRCVEYLAYKITEELLWADTALIKCKYCEETKADKKDSAAPKTSRPANVKILLSPATVIEPVYSSKGQTLPQIIPIRLKVLGPYNSAANTVRFTMLDSNLVNGFDIYDSAVIIPKADWDQALQNGGELPINLAVKSSTIKDTLGNIQKGYIVLKGQGQSVSIYGFHEVQLTSFGVFNPNKPFWMEVGSNFDLADGLTPNNFFGGVFLLKRDIRPFFSFRHKSVLQRIKREKNFGLFAGVFESKSVSDVTDSNTFVRSYYNANSLALRNGDNSGVFRDSGKLKTRQTSRNIGLFFSPQVRLTNGSANDEGFHVSASLWMELQWQRISAEVDYSGLLRRDTIFVPNSQLKGYTINDTKSEIDVRTHYFGLGLPMFYKEGETNVFFNPVWGITNQLGTEAAREDLKTGRLTNKNYQPWNIYYMFQFRLNEEHFGIAFTGEVRGLTARGNRPVVSIALSKKFDLSKFLEFK